MNRSRRTPILAVAASSLLLLAPASAHALTSATQTFQLIFTLTDIRDASTGTTAAQFILDDVFISGFAGPNPPFTTETGTGVVTNTLDDFFNGGALGGEDDFEPAIGDNWSTTRVQTATTTGAGEATVFETFTWFIDVENDSGESLLFDFSWSYTRDIDLTEMGAFDDATVFLGEDVLSFDNFEDPPDEQPIFPEPDPPTTNPLNIGTLPPGIMLMFTDSGSFTFGLDGDEITSAAMDFEWQLGARALDVPEPGAFALLFGGALLSLRRRA